MNNRLWLALIRFDRRQKAARRLVAGYRARCAACRDMALSGPPVTPEERRQHAEQVELVRQADECRRAGI